MPRVDNTPNLTLEKKAKILGEKDSGLFTVKNIAVENNVVERTVYQIAADRDPEVVELSKTFKQTLIEQAKANINKGMLKMNERMDHATSKLSEITGAVKISHDILRLETDQSTANIATVDPLRAAMDFLAACKQKGLSNADIIEGLDMLDEVDKEAREKVKLLMS